MRVHLAIKVAFMRAQLATIFAFMRVVAAQSEAEAQSAVNPIIYTCLY